ncbi:uncharacterized protein DNG_01738 [Cephalotrichum gorgonifer]|uniref:Heterokaryon incompatibility domain-containing protein n=1 Tax=Cephalotrichum gorgonifer TaxID=2041049 RepID=A0AAE8MS33_9PEZI|nr:uncharacterized protein DNG_01738 [Cephalotrichum gorgonifer]
MPLTTLESNLAQHLDFVPWDSLPPTFRDAAVIVKALGLEYLWIDSLCIIQDSTEDWELESSKMANVYGGAYVTIAAVSSPDFRGGCFSKSGKPDICHRIRREEEGLDVIIGLRDSAASSPDKLNISAELPLLSRGWVYQERMLSRRLLYCTRSELQLICRQGRGCECGRGSAALHRIETAKTYPTARDKQAYSAPLFAQMNPGQGRFGDLEAAIHWHKVVSEYSKLELSYESDKLPALSGCAKDISLLAGGEYLAGLWRHTLARDLLWDVHTQSSSRRPAEWRAPSWSWASVKATGGVTFAELAESAHLRTFLDRVTAIECQPRGKDPTGSLQSASIRLRTRLYEVSMRRVCYADLKIRSRGRLKHLIESQDMTKSTDGTPIPDRCTFEDRGLPLWGGTIRVGLNPDFEYGLDTFPWNRAKKDQGCYQAKIFLLHVCDSQVERVGKEGVDYFLALKRNSQAPPGDVYERVGLVRVIGKSDVRQRWLVEVLDQNYRTDEQEVILV